MGVKHSVLNKDGGVTEYKNLTPSRAIKLKCYDCSGWSHPEVKLCAHKKCPLYPFRMTIRGTGTRKGTGKGNIGALLNYRKAKKSSESGK